MISHPALRGRGPLVRIADGARHSPACLTRGALIAHLKRRLRVRAGGSLELLGHARPAYNPSEWSRHGLQSLGLPEANLVSPSGSPPPQGGQPAVQTYVSSRKKHASSRGSLYCFPGTKIHVPIDESLPPGPESASRPAKTRRGDARPDLGAAA